MISKRTNKNPRNQHATSGQSSPNTNEPNKRNLHDSTEKERRGSQKVTVVKKVKLEPGAIKL